MRLHDDIITRIFKALQWNIFTARYNKSIDVDVVRGCNGYVATNLGDTIAVVNGQKIFPSATPATIQGDSVSVIGNMGELYKGQQISIVFAAPLGAAPLVELTQKFYIEFDQQ